MLAFKREAEAVLRDGGYQLDHLSGKEHAIWKHPDSERPPIHLPGTPRDPDHALIRLRRAVRKGTTPHIPGGVTGIMPVKSRGKTEMPLHELMVRHASAQMHRRAANPEEQLRITAAELGAWMRKCITSHGVLSGSEIKKAAEELRLAPEQLSSARRESGSASFRYAGAGSVTDETYTDFVKRIPADAIRMNGRKLGVKTGRQKNGRVKVITEPTPPAELPVDPDEVRGRRLDLGGLTPTQHEEAERMMRESTARADAEREAMQALQTPPPAPPAPDNGSLKRSQLDEAMELLREAALADTHALTEADITMLRGHAETLRGMSASIMGIVNRVAA